MSVFIQEQCQFGIGRKVIPHLRKEDKILSPTQSIQP